MQLGGGCLTQHGQDQLDIGHVVAQVFSFQPLDLLVFSNLQVKCALHDLVGQDGKLQIVPCPHFFNNHLTEENKNSHKTWNVKIIFKTHHIILIVGEMHLDDEKTIVFITPGELMLKILRSKLKEECVLIDVPTNALARIKKTVLDVTVYG